MNTVKGFIKISQQWSVYFRIVGMSQCSQTTAGQISGIPGFDIEEAIQKEMLTGNKLKNTANF